MVNCVFGLFRYLHGEAASRKGGCICGSQLRGRRRVRKGGGVPSPASGRPRKILRHDCFEGIEAPLRAHSFFAPFSWIINKTINISHFYASAFSAHYQRRHHSGYSQNAPFSPPLISTSVPVQYKTHYHNYSKWSNCRIGFIFLFGWWPFHFFTYLESKINYKSKSKTKLIQWILNMSLVFVVYCLV